MRTLIILIVGLLAVGCLTPEQKQKSLRDSVVGEYERKDEDGDSHKRVFLENGLRVAHTNGKNVREHKWSMVNGQIHVDERGGANGHITIYRINPDKSITMIAYLMEQTGKRRNTYRHNYPSSTYKKIN